LFCHLAILPWENAGQIAGNWFFEASGTSNTLGSCSYKQDAQGVKLVLSEQNGFRKQQGFVFQ
jgi:hypothetical protein